MKNKAKNLALCACEQLVQAYKNGEAEDGSMDWNDVDQAWQTAKLALKAEKKEARHGGLPHRILCPRTEELAKHPLVPSIGCQGSY
jgi:ABC-type sugar transport system substrate-binding protein